MLGSVTTAPSWHGLWLRLIEDTTPARGALASALATRMAAPTARDPPQPLPPQTAQNTLKDLEVKKIQLHTPPAKPKVDNAFDFDSARRILTDLIAATPDVTITITAEPQERKYSETAAKAFTHDTVFTVANIFEAIKQGTQTTRTPTSPSTTSRSYAPSPTTARSTTTSRSMPSSRATAAGPLNDAACMHPTVTHPQSGQSTTL